jgi:starch phosphorylase
MIVPPNLAEGTDQLTELAMDLRWSWNHCADELWRRLDPELWALTSHPNVVPQTVSREKLAAALADPAFAALLARLVAKKRELAAAPAWFQKNIPAHPPAESPIFAWSSC